MPFSGARGADLGALLGLNPSSPPQDLATSPAENLLGAACVSSAFPALLTTKMGREISFAPQQNIRKCFPSTWL